MPVYLSIAEILISVALIVITMSQAKGGAGGLFGQSDYVYRTKRGVEKTLFQLTIVLAIIFVIIAVIGLNV